MIRSNWLQKLIILILVTIPGFELIHAQATISGMIHNSNLNEHIDLDNIMGQLSLYNNTKNGSPEKWNPQHSHSKQFFKSQETIEDWYLMDTIFSPMLPEDNQQIPETAFGISNYLVVWQDNRAGNYYAHDYDVYAARVSPEGEILDPYGIRVSVKQGVNSKESAVAFDGTNFLIVWSDNRNSPENYDIYGARVSLDGELLDPEGILICNETGNQIMPGISFNGTHYLVAWGDAQDGLTLNIYGTRIDPDGTILDPGGLDIYSNSEQHYAYATIASNGTDWMV